MAQSNIKVAVQKFGNFLSSMVMPNIGAFIAWGLITALFIPTGFFQNESLAKLVDPMVKYLLPLLIGYTGGKLVNDQRGGVVGAISMGPLGGYIIKKFDQFIEGKVKTGFEMLINNFSAGILGGILAILAFLGVSPAVDGFTGALVVGVDWMVAHGLLPLTSILIEPAKILFLNNAINHGILSPIGAEQIRTNGQSILLLLETNPGPGLGILLAYCFFGKGTAKQSAPGAAIIHFIGGIHEIYFPYVLMRPLLIIAAILGGMSGVFTFVLLGGGLQAVASPGSILAILAATPGNAGSYVANISGVLVAAVVSFIVGSLILKTGKQSEDLDEAARKMQEMKGKKSSVAGSFTKQQGEVPASVQKIVFACDAGMGSSAMGASLLRKKVKQADLNISVTNTAISNIPSDAQIVITQEELTPRAQNKVPDAYHISVDNFLSSPEYDKLIDQLKNDHTTSKAEEEKRVSAENNTDSNDGLLKEENVFLNQHFSSKEEAKKNVLRSGFTVIQVPEGVDFDGEKVRLIFGIAGKDGTHLEILSGIAITCSDMDNIEKMVHAKSAKELMAIIQSN